MEIFAYTKNFCSFIDTVESSSTVLLTPWSQAPQYYWHSGVRLRLFINITKSDSTVLMTPLSQTWYTVFHFSKVFFSALKRQLAKCLTPCLSWLKLIWTLKLLFKSFISGRFLYLKKNADSGVTPRSNKFELSIWIYPRNRSHIRKYFSVPIRFPDGLV